MRAAGQIQICPGCNLTFATNARSSSNYTAPGTETVITDPSFTENALRLHERRCERAHAIVARRIRAYEALLGRRPGRVLEVGCGDGAWAQAFLSCGIAYEALEIIPQLVEFCKVRGLPVFLSELQRWRAPYQYDVIFASQVVEHVLTPRSFAQAAFERLLPGGIFHIDVPNHSGLVALRHRVSRKGRRYGAIESPHHLIGYTPSSMRCLLKKAGFEPVLVNGLRNDHRDFGQLLLTRSRLNRLVYFTTGAIGLGSLLVGIGRKPVSLK